ncbi:MULTISPECIES: DUF4382 domain-containing protein [Salinibaculum]|uniref:DUF4382 domain-containing protein n=1 Tax=Salinibaculum TaxID=2732368 RepID=UPI0030CD903F
MQKSDSATTSRRAYLKAIGAVGAASAVGLAGCTGDAAAATGTLATAVTDQPGDIADFESCVVTIQGIWLKPASEDGDDGEDDDGDEGGDGNTTDGTSTDGDTTDGTVVEQAEEDVDESEAREYHEFDEPQTADLVELQDGATSLVDEREVAAGAYEFLQLDVSSVDGTLADGGEAQVDTPGNAPLQFKQSFEVRENQRTRFVADFTPVKRGQGSRYLLQPVATNTDVVYEATETPTDSGGSDTGTAQS